jgi:hypothetical protein
MRGGTDSDYDTLNQLNQKVSSTAERLFRDQGTKYNTPLLRNARDRIMETQSSFNRLIAPNFRVAAMSNKPIK